MKKVLLSGFAIASIVAISCNKGATGVNNQLSPTLPSVAMDYENVMLPNGLNVNAFSNVNNDILPFIDFAPHRTGQNVKVTNDGATLGRVLFYDKKLSLNNTVACGSCHHQDKAFADGTALSAGFEGRITPRSSMAILNPQMSNSLFWDSRSFSIQDLSLAPVQNHIEMGMENLDLLTAKLQKTDYYPPLFQKAFGSSTVTKENISNAMSQFVASLATSHSKFDEGQKVNFTNFSELEKQGMAIFNSQEAKCASCHAGTNFSAPDEPGGEYGATVSFGGGSASDVRGTTNIGLDLVPTDNGRKEGMFKIPSLRNISLTAPYMHDGRFKTLHDVLNHYTSGIKPTQNLDKKFKNSNGGVKHIALNEAEKIAVVAFLNTLTDQQFITDKKYSDPFMK